jgi:hypothetical protein
VLGYEQRSLRHCPKGTTPNSYRRDLVVVWSWPFVFGVEPVPHRIIRARPKWVYLAAYIRVTLFALACPTSPTFTGVQVWLRRLAYSFRPAVLGPHENLSPFDELEVPMQISSPSHRHATKVTKARPFQHRAKTRLACFALSCCLISVPMPPVSMRSAAEFAIDVLSWPVSLIRRKKSKSVKQTSVQETPADRISHASSIQISPPKRVGYQGERIPITALPLDSAGRPAHGVRVNFSSSDVTKVTLDQLNFATLVQPGVAWINASAGTATARIPVLVLAGTRALQSDAQWAADQAKLNPDGSLSTGVGSVIPSLMEKLIPTAHAQSGGGDSGDFPYDELWSDPRNGVGTPPGRVAEQTNIGEVMPEGSNFRLANSVRERARQRRLRQRRRLLQLAQRLVAAFHRRHVQRDQHMALSRFQHQLRPHRHLRIRSQYKVHTGRSRRHATLSGFWSELPDQYISDQRRDPHRLRRKRHDRGNYLLQQRGQHGRGSG